tara:strand:+ start:6573 stop:9041 length:2469 start_codon:yes stop_codon:yes gene_type:complete
MANITLGDNTKLKISIPSKGDTNWNDVVKAAFQKIVDHDHSGINGQGKKIKLQDLDQVNPTGLPQQGDTLIWDDNNQYFNFQTAASAGGSGGGSGVNHIAESTADTTVSTWATKTNLDATQAENAQYLLLTVNQNVPGNPPNVNVLRGDRSFQLEKTANVAFNYYASVPFSVPKADRGRLHTISFSYFTDATFLDNSVKVKIYDVDAAQYISVISEEIKQAQSAKKHYAQCQLSTNTNFELRLVVNNSDTQSWKMYFDDISVSPKVPVFVDGTTVDNISEYLLDKDVYAEADVDSTQAYSSSPTIVNLGSQIADTTSSLSLVTNKYTMPTTGIYDISFMAQVDSTAASTATIKLMKEVSGSATAMLTRELIVGSNSKAPIDLNLSRQFTANDKIYWELSCTASATLESGGFFSVSKKQSPQTLSESSEVVAFHITNQVDSTETNLPNPAEQSDTTVRKQVNVLPAANKISTIVDTHSAVDATNRLVKIARSGLYKITTKVAIKDYDQDLKKIQIRKFTAADVQDPAKGNGNVANVASSNAVNAVSTSLDFEQLIAVESEIAIGTVIPYGGGDVPEGYTICQGASLSNSAYKRLKSALDNKFDTSDYWNDTGDTKTTYSAPGSSSFRVPDLRNSYMRGVSNVSDRGDNQDYSTNIDGLKVTSSEGDNKTTKKNLTHAHLVVANGDVGNGVGNRSANHHLSRSKNAGYYDEYELGGISAEPAWGLTSAEKHASTGSTVGESLNHNHEINLVDENSRTETRPNTTKMNFLIKSMNFKIMESTFFAQLDAGDYIFVNARTDTTGIPTARLDLSNAFNFELKGERLK